MLASQSNSDQIYIRLGWEFNTNGWFPWSAAGQEANYAQAYRNFVDAFRSVSDKFVFEWTPNAGDMGSNPEASYPGDKYVDVIGTDFYYNTQWDPKDPIAAWNWYVNEPHGLQWQQDFAAAHGKPTAIGEWGVNSDTAGPFIALAAQWFKDHNMLYQNYWDSNAAFQGSMSDRQYPNASAVFDSIFGKGMDPYASDTTPVIRGGGSGVDLMIGHAGNDTLNGGGGDDLLHGGGGNDLLYGGAGNDLLDGGTGADTMYGGTGNDTYYVDNVNDKVIELQGEGNDTVYSSVDYNLAGTFVETLQLVGHDNISATGNSQANTLIGNDGNNVLNGMGGADIMKGGLGDDTYYVDNPGDQVIELPGQGTDKVYASVDFNIGSQSIEVLELTGAGNLNATGNSDANTIIGNAGDNVIRGMGGDDILTGNGGNDTFIFEKTGHATVTDFGGSDLLDLTAFTRQGITPTFVANASGLEVVIDASTTIQLNGLSASDLEQVSSGIYHHVATLTGDAMDNVIQGTAGADTMAGGAGNDTYFVNNAGDKVIEHAGEGQDTVWASVSFDAGDQSIETIHLTGAANLTASGNADANTIYGNDGNNVIDGRGGADVMYGGKGDDTYYVDNVNDKVVELQGEGNDTVYSSVDYSLAGQFVETLRLTGTANLHATGNSQANTLIGNSGNNVINGMGGNDVLTGGGGNDTFVFTKSGHATITDFGTGDTMDVAAFLNTGSHISLVQKTGGTLVSLDANNDVFLPGVTINHLVTTDHGLMFA